MCVLSKKDIPQTSVSTQRFYTLRRWEFTSEAQIQGRLSKVSLLRPARAPRLFRNGPAQKNVCGGIADARGNHAISEGSEMDFQNVD